MTIDPITQRWLRNVSDERAAAAGCKVDEACGQHVLDFAAKYLRLYEGDQAGQPLEPMPWQVDLVMRLFGWVKWSERWKRWIRRFRAAAVWVPKKNGKSPTLAWLGLYLLCADGEQGQKVYLCAKDGGQAREIAGKHALEMVHSSPELSTETDINKTLMQITHLPSRSILKPISSNDSKSQKAKEGLNGSILVDEVHVVDAEFMARVCRAGISRSEPLQIEVSTAGNDPESYGKQRWDYGLAVENGTFTDESFLHIAYAAPQDLTDEQLALDPVQWGQLANPAWGITIDPDEYLADYRRSKVSIQALADFKMYRLNVWQHAANPWLRMSDWKKCEQHFAEEDLRGQPCYAGLDLSRTRDLTALALVFPSTDLVSETEEAEAYRLLVYYWCPEESARDRNDKVPFLSWAKDGWITLTPGGTCDFAAIRKRFRELCDLFDVRELAYDPWNAEETTAAMSEGVAVEGVEIESGTGVPRVLFRQGIVSYAAPTDHFEKCVIDGRLHHNGNPVTTWQAGHVSVLRDVNENKRPVKPGAGSKRASRTEDYRTVDGIQASVMAMARAMLGQGGESVYSTRGILTI